MIGILTEKPSARRNFEKALGGQKGNFNGENYVLTNARGHLYELKMPEKQVVPTLSEQYRQWKLTDLPWNEKDLKWVRQAKSGTSTELRNIKSVLSSCDEIVIASDDDPTGEGSLLAWEIIDELGLSHKKISRMYFVDEAPKSIQKAFINRKPLTTSDKDPDYIKAWFRSRWDFLSMQFTRIATAHGNGRAVLRNGRLKSAINYLVGQQIDAVKAYKKVPSYENRFKDENGVVYSSVDEPSYPKKEDVPNIYKPSEVILDSKTMKKTAPPKLLDLAGLSARLSSEGYKADAVLSCYQKLYENQIVSYPRTEDKFITSEQFDELLPKVDQIASVVGANIALLTHRTKRSTHVKTGGSHGANRPGLNVPKSLAVLESTYGKLGVRIYEILASSYLAMLAEDYEYENQKGHLKDYPKFTGSCNVPKSLGFKAIFKDDDEVDDSNEKGLGKMASPFIYEGFPPKPQEPTMKWLMKQLEKYDVGTGATRTSTYADVTNQKSKYPLLKENKGKISMTEFGEMNYLLLPNTNIGNLKLTESLMQDMRDISKGLKNPEEILADVQRLVRMDKEVMEKNGQNMRKVLGVNMATRNDADYARGNWNGKDIKFKKIFSGYTFTDDEVEKLLDGEEIPFSFIAKSGKKCDVLGKLAEKSFKGNDGKLIKYVGVDIEFQQTIPDVFCQHTFTDDEKSMLEMGKAILVKDYVSKKGNTFSAMTRFGERDDGSKGIILEFN